MPDCSYCGGAIKNYAQQVDCSCWMCDASLTVHSGCAPADRSNASCKIHRKVKKPKPADVATVTPVTPPPVTPTVTPVVAVTKPPVVSKPPPGDKLAMPGASKTTDVVSAPSTASCKAKRPPLKVYHATAVPFDAIDLSYGRTNLDFNPEGQGCFYIGKDLDAARAWADRQAAAKKKKAVIYEYEIDRDELDKLQGYKFIYNSGDRKFVRSQEIPENDPQWTLQGFDARAYWQETVAKGRDGTLDWAKYYDFLEGPMLLNPKDIPPSSNARAGGHQIALISQKAVDLFNSSPRNIVT